MPYLLQLDSQRTFLTEAEVSIDYLRIVLAKDDIAKVLKQLKAERKFPFGTKYQNDGITVIGKENGRAIPVDIYKLPVGVGEKNEAAKS